jgi:hypothetical protein
MLHERDQDYPLYHMHPELRPILPEFGTEEEIPPPPQQP